MKKSCLLRVVCVSILTINLCVFSGINHAATVIFGVNNLARGITDLEFDGRFWDINFILLPVMGNESLFPTLGDPSAGRELAIVINEVLNEAGPVGVLPENVGAASDRYIIPGEITMGPTPLTLVENSSQGFITDGFWDVRLAGPFQIQGAPVVATASAVPLPPALPLLASALALLAWFRRKAAL